MEHVVHLDEARVAAAVMLGVAAVGPLLPGAIGLPCPLRALTGIPCPLCGMTTSVMATVHLHLGAAAAATPAGIVAVVLAIVLLVGPRRTSVAAPAWLAPSVLAVMWLYQLFRLSIL